MDGLASREKQKQMILNEGMWKLMIRLSWPAILAMVLYGLNTVFDAIFVGQFVGETALAGVSIAYPLSQFTLGVGSLIGVGAGSALSIALGANDERTQHRILGNVNYMSIIIGLVYTVAAWFAAEPLVRMMGGSGEELVLGTQYFRVTVIGSVFWMHGLACNMVVRAEGKMKAAALMMGIGLTINIIANYVLITVLDFGVKGAAWGTNIAMFVYTIVGLWYFKNKKASFDARPFKVQRDKEIIKSIVSMGMPSMIMSIMSLIQGVVVLNALARYGTTYDIAFFGATYRVFMLMLTPLFGLMRALQPAAGINYGAGDHERVIQSAKVFSFGGILFMLPFWLLMMIFPQGVLLSMLPGRIFSMTDLMNFRVYMALLPVLPVVFMSMTFFPAINYGKAASLMGIARQLVFYVPVMLILPRLFGIKWVYFGSTLIDIMIAVLAIFMFTMSFRKLRKEKYNIELEAQD